MKLIDADEFAKTLYENIRNDNLRIYSEVCNHIKNAPSVDAEPRRHGEWELYGNEDNLDMTYFCSACNFQLDENLFYIGYKDGKWIENNVFKYCPNCGAKMDGERKEE